MIDSIIFDGYVYVISKVMQVDLFNSIPKLSQVDVSGIYFKDIEFGFLLEQRRPMHYFYDQLRYFIRFDCPKNIYADNSFFIPRSSLISNKIDENVYLFPSGIAATQMSTVIDYAKSNEVVRKIDHELEAFIREEVLQGKKKQKNNFYDLILWFTICTEHRVWVQQISGYLNIASELLKYFKNIKIYFDGITADEGKKIENSFDWHIFNKIKEVFSDIKGCDIEPLIGISYREKILKGNEIDYFICESGTATIVPLKFLEKDGVVYSNSNYYKVCNISECLSKVKIVNPIFLQDVLMHKKALFQHVHIPWQHLFNLLVEVIGDSKICKIEVPSLNEVVLNWAFQEIIEYKENKIWYEKIYDFALIFAKANQFEVATILIENIFNFLNKEQKINANDQLKLYREFIKNNESDKIIQ
ncbi:TPA: hypothetical protein SC008_001733, partial [Campylobacter jejuni]|nr:hypothetical protein [Campylobacter jejuni]